MPFGLKNVGATYQRLVNQMFEKQIGRNVEVYVDDILVKSKEEEDHLDNLKETFNTLRHYSMNLNPSKEGEDLFLYLAVSIMAINTALIKEENRLQFPVYYINQAFQGAEAWYPRIEKITFALIVASRNLHPYFQANPIIVMTD